MPKRNKSLKSYMRMPEWALINQDGIIGKTRAKTKRDAKGVFERNGVMESGMVVMRVAKK